MFGSQNCWFTNWLWTLDTLVDGWAYFIFALTNIHFKWKSTLLMAVGYWYFFLFFFVVVSYSHHSQNSAIDVVILYILYHIFFFDDQDIGFHFSIWKMYSNRRSSFSAHLVFAKWKQLKTMWHTLNDVHLHEWKVCSRNIQKDNTYTFVHDLFENGQQKKKKKWNKFASIEINKLMKTFSIETTKWMNDIRLN